MKAVLSILCLIFAMEGRASNDDVSAQPKCRDLIEGAGSSISAEFQRVVDGDTIKVRIAGTAVNIRLLSIDTPETHFQGKSQGPWGEKASSYLSTLVRPGHKVRIEFDQVGCDKFGRILGHVFSGKLHLNQVMVEEGLAVNYCIAPNLRYCDVFSKIVAGTIKARKGIFGDPSLEIPYEWRKSISDLPWDKWAGDSRSNQVYEPREYRQVPVANRVFFMTKKDIQPPYRLAKPE